MLQSKFCSRSALSHSNTQLYGIQLTGTNPQRERARVERYLSGKVKEEENVSGREWER